MLKINGYKISLTRGDTAYLDIDITKENGTPYIPHEGDKVIFSVKRNSYDKEFAFQKQVDVGETIMIYPKDTQNLECGRYWYDIQLNTTVGEIFTIIEKNMFCIGEEITNE